ncbi:TatD family hydrolase [Thermoproteota archaeon]
MKRLIDSHIHMESFKDPHQLKLDSKKVGIDALICVGGDKESSIEAMKVAKEFPDFFYPAIGVHPVNILKEDRKCAEDFIRENLSQCVALGEVGLDYTYDFARPTEVRARMRCFFERLLVLASDIGAPASIHSRSAYSDSVEIAGAVGVEAVFHWYDGPIHTLRKLLDHGFYVSATPSVEYNKGASAVMLEAPLERILVETDSPVFLRNLSRMSTPVDVVRVVDALAELKCLDPVEVAKVTTRNTEKLFRL